MVRSRERGAGIRQNSGQSEWLLRDCIADPALRSSAIHCALRRNRSLPQRFALLRSQL
jgi:hypothetical protein